VTVGSDKKYLWQKPGARALPFRVSLRRRYRAEGKIVKRHLRILAGLVFLAFTALAVVAQTIETRIYRVTFPTGSTGTTIDDRVTGTETIIYRVNAKAGQVMQISLDSPRGTVTFDLYAPGRTVGDTPLATGSSLGPTVPAVNRFQGSLPRSGDYSIAVRLARDAANRGDTSRFTLRLVINDGAVNLPGSNPAPDDSGFLTVAGVRSGDRLNVRAGPSTGYRVLYTLGNGDVVRNLGCSTEADRSTWCNIHPAGDPSRSGWASAWYLVSARDPGNATQLPSPPPAARPPETATGRIDCVLAQVPLRCVYTVTRRGNGDATLVIERPFTTSRKIEFSGGRPVSANSSQRLFGEWQGDAVIVSVGSNEKYTVPNRVLFGR
jgi:uncharacterized protein YgiM (DUF1202 family)